MIFRFLFAFFSGLFIAWFSGLCWFYFQIPAYGYFKNMPVKTDAIIALTGGKGRVEHAFNSLIAGDSNVLFISGVGKDTTLQNLAEEYDLSMEKLLAGSKEILLGYEAKNTIGNAEEVAQWMQYNDYKSIRVVTSNYHLPRALLEFRYAMPHIIMLPMPVYSKQDTSFPHAPIFLTISEYHKWVWQAFKYRLVGR